jgi:hypothetical protein
MGEGRDVDPRSLLVMEWLEGEGERRRTPALLPPRVGDPAVRGWVQFGVCTVVLALGSWLFGRWLAEAWYRAIRIGAVRPTVLNASDKLAPRAWDPASRQSVPLWGTELRFRVRVVEVGQGVGEDGGPGAPRLVVSHRGRLVFCEFREENFPWDLRAGDTIVIRSAAGWVPVENDGVLQKDCEVVERSNRPGE